MDYCLITFRSVTWAQKAEALLRRLGYQCVLRRTARWMEAQGCGYSLRVSAENVTRCVEQLKLNHILFQKIYQYNSAGEPEEMQL